MTLTGNTCILNIILYTAEDHFSDHTVGNYAQNLKWNTNTNEVSIFSKVAIVISILSMESCKNLLKKSVLSLHKWFLFQITEFFIIKKVL